MASPSSSASPLPRYTVAARTVSASPSPTTTSVPSSPSPSDFTLYTLSDSVSGVTVSVAPSRGAEISSLTLRGLELVHRANDFSPAGSAEEDPAGGGWYGHGQVLFPAVGRHKGGQYQWGAADDGGEGPAEPRPMPLHGFAKDSVFRVVEGGGPGEGGAAAANNAEEASLTCVLEGDAAAAAPDSPYPFSFRLAITFSLADGVVRVTHRVTNTAAAPSLLLPFAIGNHITLRFPFTPDGSWESGRLLSTVTHEHELAPGSLLSGALHPRPAFQSPAGMPLTAPGATDGVFGGDTGRPADPSLAPSPCSLMVVQPGGVAVEVAHTVRLAEAAGQAPACDWAAVAAHRHFVLWGQAPPRRKAAGGEGEGAGEGTSSTVGGTAAAAGFICPEPWVSGPDSLNTRAGLPVLRPGQVGEWVVCIAATGP
jgi:galactose mutarotase-like enzyme